MINTKKYMPWLGALSLGILLSCTTATAQVKVGSNVNTIDASAAFEIESTSGGLLMPRLSTAQRDAISNPASGLTLYNTTTQKFEIFNGSSWESIDYSSINITASPTNQTISDGGNASFSVTASGSNLTYQWQESTNGGSSYTNLSNGGIYSGVTTSQLSLTAVTTANNGYLYRCVISDNNTSVNSAAATLTVN